MRRSKVTYKAGGGSCREAVKMERGGRNLDGGARGYKPSVKRGYGGKTEQKGDEKLGRKEGKLSERHPVEPERSWTGKDTEKKIKVEHAGGR